MPRVRTLQFPGRNRRVPIPKYKEPEPEPEPVIAGFGPILDTAYRLLFLGPVLSLNRIFAGVFNSDYKKLWQSLNNSLIFQILCIV